MPFTNAVLRRVGDGIAGLIAALPEGTAQEAGLRHSYPDWVAETWWRDLGPAGARACMLAQNEPAERLDRVVERPRALDGAVREPPCERAVTIVQVLGGAAQRAVGVRAVLEDAHEHLVRRAPGRRYLSPRSHASYDILRPPSG